MSGTGHEQGPKVLGVQYIPINELQPNPHNPRILFDRLPLANLKASINKVGILVPLTVFWSDAKKTYVILDGQRRWICARELALKTVPANLIAEPELVQNIVTMFQIHKLREDWELMPTALKLEVLMDKLDEKREKPLAELTGLDQAVVARCKKLLSFPRRLQDLMLSPEPGNRVKADFFIELYPVISDRQVKKMEWFRREPFTDRMLAKYQAGKGLKAVTDFREMKQHINNAVKAKKLPTITKRLHEFTNDDELPLSHLEIRSASVEADARKLRKSVSALAEAVQSLDVSSFYGEEDLWQELEALMALIKAKLLEAGRRIK